MINKGDASPARVIPKKGIAGSRMSAKSINRFKPRPRRTLISGDGLPVPLIYGRAAVDGHIIAQGLNGTDLVIGVGWCLGYIHQIEQVFINGEPITSDTIIANHYKGDSVQGVDPDLAAAITGYADDLIIDRPAGSIGIAYSVFTIPTSQISSVPSFTAIINGRLVEQNDYSDYPEKSTNYTDTTAVEIVSGNEFTSLIAGDDTSKYVHTVNFYNGGSWNDTGLICDGDATPTAAYLEPITETTAGSEFNLGYKNFCFEIKCKTDIVTSDGPKTLFVIGAGNPERGIVVYRTGSTLYVSASADGVNWDIDISVSSFFTAGTEVEITIERIGTQCVLRKDGTEVARDCWPTATTPVNYAYNGPTAESGNVCIGSFHNASTTGWDGTVWTFRMTNGAWRYGHDFENDLVYTETFSDIPWRISGLEYHENPARFMQDLATNDIYGLGATISTYDVLPAISWADTLVYTSNAPRARTGLVFDQKVPVVAILDLLAEYANCVWFLDGDVFNIRADAPYTSGLNATGLEEVTATSAAWTEGTGWTYTEETNRATRSSVASATSLTQNLTGLVAGGSYAITIVNYSFVRGSSWPFTVEWNGTPVITVATKGNSGQFSALVTAASGTNVLEVVGLANNTAYVGNMSVRATTWETTTWVKDSLSLQGVSSSGLPTSVMLRYTEQADDNAAWGQATHVETTAAATAGTEPFIQTVIDMPGIYRAEEAESKAKARLARMTNKTIVAWITTDSGVVHTTGDVIRLVNTSRGVDIHVRVDSVTMQSYGRYRVRGELYSSTHYPDD